MLAGVLALLRAGGEQLGWGFQLQEPAFVFAMAAVLLGTQDKPTPLGSFPILMKDADHVSRTYDNAPMPYAIFYNGGYAVHATFDLKRLGRPASHGCVRLHPDNAAVFFSMAQAKGLRNTRIVIAR